MSSLSLYAATISGLLFAFLLGAGPWGVFLFALLGGAGHLIAGLMPARSERVYWYALGVLILFILLNMFGLGLHRNLMVAPLVLMLGHFVSRVASRVLGRRAS